MKRTPLQEVIDRVLLQHQRAVLVDPMERALVAKALDRGILALLRNAEVLRLDVRGPKKKRRRPAPNPSGWRGPGPGPRTT